MLLGLGMLVLGLARPGNEPVFCYAQLLDRPAEDRYPPPLLPKDMATLEHEVVPASDGRFEVHIWERRLRDDETAAVEAGLASGRLRLPADCPIQGGAELAGPLLPLTIVHESSDPLPAQGAGLVTSTGFVVDAAVSRVIEALGGKRHGAEAARDLGRLLPMLDQAAGLNGLFVRSRRFGVVERLSRSHPADRGTLLLVKPVKPDLRSNDPCRAITLHRTEATPANDLSVYVRTEAWKTITAENMISVPAEAGAVTVDVESHITGVDILVFDSTSGSLLEQQHLSLAQSIDLSLRAVGGEDQLPPPFNAAPPSPDLTQRPRLHSSHSVIHAPGRAPGLEALLRSSRTVDTLIGAERWKPESRFFRAGIEPQLEVIRWLKEHMEAPGTTEAFLVDPYLGSQAFERVVLRQGNENVKLTVVVSPGNVDPDAVDLDTKVVANSHIDELVRMAERHASKLCGNITLIHVKRGGGVRQAFHDRYFGLVQREGPPRVFLLSNSLSKAAGDWPFTVAEVDTPTAWEIADYIGTLTQAADIKSLAAEVVWRSPEPVAAAQVPPPSQPTGFGAAIWTAYEALFPLMHDNEDVDVAGIVADLAKALPIAARTPELARAIVDGMHGRLRLAGVIADTLANSERNAALAEAIEDVIVDEALVELAPRNGLPPQWLPDEPTLRRAGRRLGQRQGGTNLVRSRMNPALHRYSTIVERDRKGVAVLQAFLAGLGFIVVGLELAATAESVKIEARTGIAIDYLHGLGRLLRTPAAHSVLAREAGRSLHSAASIHRLAMQQARTLATGFGGDVGAAYQKLATDPFIHPQILEPLPPEPRRYSGLKAVDPLET